MQGLTRQLSSLPLTAVNRHLNMRITSTGTDLARGSGVSAAPHTVPSGRVEDERDWQSTVRILSTKLPTNFRAAEWNVLNH